MISGVSVIIPHYNSDRFITRAVQSVDEQLDYTHSWLRTQELLVVDDGSAAESWDRTQLVENVFHHVGQQWWFRHTENRGQGFALNYGVDRSTTDTLAFLDADDVWEPKKLALQLQVLDEHPGVEIVVGHAREFRVESVLGEPRPARLVSALMVRRKAFERIGAFREDLGAGMTLEWFARAEDVGAKIVMLKEPVYRRRIHGDNYGVRNRERARFEYLAAARLILERRRGKAE